MVAPFDGELLATYTEEKTTFHALRYLGRDAEGFFIHWRDELSAWLETGRLGGGGDCGV